MARTVALALLAGMLVLGFVGGTAYGAWTAYSVRQKLALANAQIRQAQRDLEGVRVAATPAPASMSAGVTTSPPTQSPETRPTAPPDGGLPSVQQLAAACQRANTAESALGSLGAGGLGLALEAARQLPLLGERAGAATDLLTAGREASQGLVSMCRGMQPLLDALAESGGGGQGSSSGQIVVAALEKGRPDLEQASVLLASARGRIEHLDPASTQGLGDDGARAARILREQLPKLELATETLLVLPTLFGGDGPRTFLVLSQNSDELRPTGGFVGTAGLMRMDKGAVTEFALLPSPEFDVPSSLLVTPPDPLRRFLRSNYWQLRDANWWPDFPSSAAQVEYFWNLLGRGKVDGVLALDQRAVELILEQVGPVHVPEFNEDVDAANMRRRLDEYVHQRNYSSEDERKAFVDALSRAVLKEVTQASPVTAMQVGSALRIALEEKHVIFTAHDPRTAAMLARSGWDGALLPANGGDYLYVTHNNLTPNKHSRDMEQRLEYAVRRDGDAVRGHLTIRLKSYMQPMPLDEQRPYLFVRENLYRDYLRIYVPEGAELESASGFIEPPLAAPECGRMAISGTVELKPAERATIELTYRLPPPIAQQVVQGSYSLTLQKQPGTIADGFLVSVDGAGQVERSMRLDRFLRVESGTLVLGERPDDLAPVAAGQPLCAIQDSPPRVLAPPERIVLERAGVDASIVNLGVDQDGVMQIPETGDVVGWYNNSAYPGFPGNSVFSGHVDWEKKAAVFAGLRSIQKGDEIRVLTTDGTWQTYAVEHNWLIPFDAPARDFVGPTYENWMTIITCDGEFDQVTHNYLKRRVIRAQLVTDRAAGAAAQH